MQMSTSERIARHALLPMTLAFAFLVLCIASDLIVNHKSALFVPQSVVEIAQGIRLWLEEGHIPAWLSLSLFVSPIGGATIGMLARRSRAGRVVLLLSLLSVGIFGMAIAADDILPNERECGCW